MISTFELVERGLSIQDEFLSPAAVTDLLQCLHARRARGEFAPARIGSGQALTRREDIRGDVTCWLTEPLYAAELRLLDCFEQLRLQLNREALLGLLDLELHYAAYPPGTGYARHVDQPRGTNRRKVSVVLYLNEDWPASAGGELRVFSIGQSYVDVQPSAGRLVCFMTADREHCVLPALRERFSVTGWFNVRD